MVKIVFDIEYLKNLDWNGQVCLKSGDQWIHQHGMTIKPVRKIKSATKFQKVGEAFYALEQSTIWIIDCTYDFTLFDNLELCLIENKKEVIQTYDISAIAKDIVGKVFLDLVAYRQSSIMVESWARTILVLPDAIDKIGNDDRIVITSWKENCKSTYYFEMLRDLPSYMTPGFKAIHIFQDKDEAMVKTLTMPPELNFSVRDAKEAMRDHIWKCRFLVDYINVDDLLKLS